MLVSDKWNPRLWLRAWLLAPSKTEAVQAARIRAGVEAACAAWQSKGDGDADKKHNGQILGRYLDGVVKTLPSDLEDAWVMSLPEPYRSNCERALGRRRGILPIRMDAIETSADTVGVGQLMKDFGDLCAAVSPAVADGVIDEKDRPHGQKIINETDDLVISALTFRKAVIRAMGLEQKA